MSIGKAVVKASVMDEEMENFAIEQANESLYKANSEKVNHFMTLRKLPRSSSTNSRSDTSRSGTALLVSHFILIVKGGTSPLMSLTNSGDTSTSTSGRKGS